MAAADWAGWRQPTGLDGGSRLGWMAAADCTRHSPSQFKLCSCELLQPHQLLSLLTLSNWLCCHGNRLTTSEVLNRVRQTSLAATIYTHLALVHLNRQWQCLRSRRVQAHTPHTSTVRAQRLDQTLVEVHFLPG